MNRPDRRRLLALLGAAGGTFAGIGAVQKFDQWADQTRGEGTQSDLTRPDDPTQYDRVVDVAYAGADDTGEEPIDEVLDAVLVDDTKVVFPPGTYLVDGFERGGLERVAFVGDGATIVPRGGMTGALFDLGGRDLTIDGFDFDYTLGRTAPQIAVSCADDLTIANCQFRGIADVWGGTGPSSHEYHLLLRVTDPDGEGSVRNVRLADGSASPSNRGGIWVGPDHRGRLTFDRVRLVRWANNSLYVDASDGSVVVRNSTFLNNCVSGPRFGNARARVENTSVIADGWVPVQGFSAAQESRGVWVNVTCESVEIEGCSFDMTGPYADDAIVYGDWTGHGVWTHDETPGRETDLSVDDCSFVLADGLEAVQLDADGANVTTRELTIDRP